MATVQRAITATVAHAVAGYWRVIAHPPYGDPVDATIFRGIPVKVGDFSFTDPFGPKDMTLVFPQVTIFDARGQGDLSWMVKDVNVDVIWEGDLPANYPFGLWVAGVWTPMWRWEGYTTSFSIGSSGLTIQLKGALLQLDKFLAKPEYASRPMPYEWAIQRQFLNKPSLRVMPLKVTWPTWWTKTYTAPGPETMSYMVPSGVTDGQKWTALKTRTTGNWDPTLTSYVQSLLSSMYTERGRWTIELQAHRQPVLFHREFIDAPDAVTVVVDPTHPDVKIDLTEDGEQSLTTVYGQGTSLAGVAYSGMNVSDDGTETSYVPLAAAPQVWPALATNLWLDDQVMATEVMIQMQVGMDAEDAAIVARAHLSRFRDPGVTGTVTLGVDPMMGGVPIPRHLVRAGMELHVPFVLGRPEGVLMHISNSVSSISSGTVALTVDSKRRDALTVDEVRLRGRDALSISRMLVAGQYTPPVPDQVYPWSYEAGSGYIPSNPTHSAVKLFKGIPNEVTFPWVEWTKARPPSDPAWTSCYMHLGPVSSNANLNWITQQTPSGTAVGIPIKMAQAGSIRLLQFAAYHADGTVFKIPFHIGFYYISNVNVLSMPKIPSDQALMYPPFAAAQHYPFVRDGFEVLSVDGTKADPNVPQPTQSVGLLRVYGTFFEKAGFSPGTYAEGDKATGLLADESIWQFDTSSVDANFDPYDIERNLTNPKSGRIYAMIYCDAQGAEDVYFMGRMYRAELGVS